MPTTFEPGTSLSHYRVIAPLGAGGMGEVYKAQDLTLDRAVALKILPPELVRNDERVRRFVQEAKSASSLNHPNIVTIHEIGQASQASDGHPIHYIAMELIDGTTLKRKIHEEQIDLRTLLVYLSQAAEGLAKAHAAGIVHRDLKPENVMVTRDGYAKVLDFGLAKLNIKKSAENTSESTAVRNDTREGVLLGTVGYMSPEQVQAKPVDHRSDIFSFGSILYEAATRRRPFEADSDVEIMHKIMHDKPVPIDEINAAVPAELRRMIRRCLAKDPDKRYQSMKDLSLELSEIVDEFEQLSASASSRSGSAAISGDAVAAPPQARRVWALLAAVALVALAAIAFGIHQWRQATTQRAAGFASMKLTRLTSTGNVVHAAISPDGKYVAQVLRRPDGRFTLSVRQVATGSDVQVFGPSTTPIAGVAFSPDGDYVLYGHREEESGAGYASLFQIPTLGGTPRKIVFDVDTAVAFSPDGKQIAFGRGYPDKGENAVVVVNADGSSERIMLMYQRLFAPAAPSWSPDGKTVLTPRPSLDGGLHTRLVQIDVQSGQAREFATRWMWAPDAVWLPDMSAVVTIAGRSDRDRFQIWLEPAPEGEPVRITNDLNNYAGLSVTADGKALLTRRTDRINRLMLSEVGDASGGTSFGAAAADQIPLIVSASATDAVVYAFEHDNGEDIAIIERPGSQARVLTTDGKSGAPSISSDGRTIAFHSWREGDMPHIFIMDSDGSNVRQLTRSATAEVDPVIAPDGSTVVFRTADAIIWSVPTASGPPRKLVERTRGAYVIDGQSARLAYAYWGKEGNRIVNRLAVIPLTGGATVADMPFSAAGGVGTLRWSPSNDALTFVRHGAASQVIHQPLDGSPATVLTRFERDQISSFDWTADGKLVMSRGEQRSDAVLISDFR